MRNFDKAFLILFCALFMACSSARHKERDFIPKYLIWIREKPKNKNFIDYTEGYWLLESCELSVSANNCLSIGNTRYAPLYVDFDFIYNLPLCCGDSLFQKESIYYDFSNIKSLSKQEILPSKGRKYGYSNYHIEVFSVNSEEFCKCNKNYSGMNSEIVSLYAYPVKSLTLKKIKRQESNTLKKYLKNIVNHPEIFGFNDRLK
ncbi:MAG TPA: hypothetical protein PKC76_19370 [Saprospiraceae bacterium]|nr:hypothetical protein [Saprospiraceae bacterium]